MAWVFLVFSLQLENITQAILFSSSNVNKYWINTWIGKWTMESILLYHIFSNFPSETLTFIYLTNVIFSNELRSLRVAIDIFDMSYMCRAYVQTI